MLHLSPQALMSSGMVQNGVQVSVANSLRRQLCGMCGFYNRRSNDDLRLSGTTQTTTDIERFCSFLGYVGVVILQIAVDQWHQIKNVKA